MIKREEDPRQEQGLSPADSETRRGRARRTQKFLLHARRDTHARERERRASHSARRIKSHDPEADASGKCALPAQNDGGRASERDEGRKRRAWTESRRRRRRRRSTSSSSRTTFWPSGPFFADASRSPAPLHLRWSHPRDGFLVSESSRCQLRRPRRARPRDLARARTVGRGSKVAAERPFSLLVAASSLFPGPILPSDLRFFLLPLPALPAPACLRLGVLRRRACLARSLHRRRTAM